MADHIVLFTVDEANALLPQLREWLRELGDIRGDILTKQGKLEVLHLIHGERVLEEINPDHQDYLLLRQEMETLVKDFNEVVAEIVDTGALLKELDIGLVDLYAERDGEIVFLCWQQDEDRVAHWHPLRGGMAMRQPLTDAEIRDNQEE